jgi:hypothetical protein
LVKSLGDRPPDRSATALVFDASRVGNNPEAVPLVIGANGASWDAIPPSVVPERGQAAEYSSKPGTKETWRVLHDDDPRS